MSKVNELFMDECERQFDALVAGGMDPEDARDAITPQLRDEPALSPDPGSQTTSNGGRDAE